VQCEGQVFQRFPVDPFLEEMPEQIDIPCFPKKPLPTKGHPIGGVHVLLDEAEMHRMVHEIPDDHGGEMNEPLPKGTIDGVALLQELHHRLLQLAEDRGNQRILALEIAVDRAGPHARPLGDHGHGGPVKSLLRDQFESRLHDLFALVRILHAWASETSLSE